MQGRITDDDSLIGVSSINTGNQALAEKARTRKYRAICVVWRWLCFKVVGRICKSYLPQHFAITACFSSAKRRIPAN